MLNLSRTSLSDAPLNAAINTAIEQASLMNHAAEQPRNYLGPSLIGHECSRAIQFTWLTNSTFSARVRSIFARGHYFELESKQQLVDAGFKFAPTEALGFVTADGLVAGHADEIITHIPGVAFAVPAVWECKALNAKNYRAVERDGLGKAFPRYAAQIALYQRFLDITNPALFTVVNADTCERLHSLVEFNARLAQEALDRAMTVIAATRAGELLPRFDPSLEDFRCRWCGHLERCRRYE